MKSRYIELIEQMIDFPQEEFQVANNKLQFHGLPLMDIVKKYGTPLKLTYLPKIGQNINNVKTWFGEAIKANNYNGTYSYCYCTKSSHFSFVLNEVLKNDVHLETSSAFDVDIIESLYATRRLKKDRFIIFNGYKQPEYLRKAVNVIEKGFNNAILSIDNHRELFQVDLLTDHKINLGIRIAAEESPNFKFYTSRLGIGYMDIIPFYKSYIQDNPKFELKMLHFFVNKGIKDNAYYWNELEKAIKVYCSLKKICPELRILNIGGGFPIKTSLSFDFDYQYVVNEIVTKIKDICDEEEVETPDIFSEFGSYTVGESGATIFTVIDQKLQNDREKWNMINSSFMTTLPDTWGISQKFIMLPLNLWTNNYERVLLGGITCDSEDYYDSEQHSSDIYLPKIKKGQTLHIGFFNTGAYQESIGGYGGINHCLLPTPKHLIIHGIVNGKPDIEIFAPQQESSSVLNILGYKREEEISELLQEKEQDTKVEV